MTSMLKEKDGKWSITRVSIFLVLIFYMTCAGYIVHHKKEIPPMPTALSGLLVGLYTFNRANINIGGAKKEGNNNNEL